MYGGGYGGAWSGAGGYSSGGGALVQYSGAGGQYGAGPAQGYGGYGYGAQSTPGYSLGGRYPAASSGWSGYSRAPDFGNYGQAYGYGGVSAGNYGGQVYSSPQYDQYQPRMYQQRQQQYNRYQSPSPAPAAYRQASPVPQNADVQRDYFGRPVGGATNPNRSKLPANLGRSERTGEKPSDWAHLN